MYAKYQTEALVLDEREVGESDRLYALYTREFGLVHARARAVREERSRMRFALQILSRAEVSLIRGNRGWRIAGARSIDCLPGERPENARVLARLGKLVVRLNAGEEQNAYAFETLAAAHGSLKEMRSQEALGAIELLAAARILHALGYLSAEGVSAALFVGAAYEESDVQGAARLKDTLLVAVNKAIAETQL